MTVEKLNELKNIDIRTVDIDTLADIKDINIDINLPIEQKMKLYLEQIKNPYLVRCGKYIIKMTFPENTGLTLKDCFYGFLDNL